MRRLGIFRSIDLNTTTRVGEALHVNDGDEVVLAVRATGVAMDRVKDAERPDVVIERHITPLAKVSGRPYHVPSANLVSVTKVNVLTPGTQLVVLCHYACFVDVAQSRDRGRSSLNPRISSVPNSGKKCISFGLASGNGWAYMIAD